MNSFFVNLNELELMAVSGEDNKKFLQGQLTCNVDTLSEQISCLGASCDNKGRVLSNFRLVNFNKIYYLQMQTGLLPLLKKSLEKYSVFSKVDIESSQHSFNQYGIVGDDAERFLAKALPKIPVEVNEVISFDDGLIIKISNAPKRYELWLKTETSEFLSSIKQTLVEQSKSSWEILDIKAGIYQIELEDSALYTPQTLNLDLAGFIDFSKGCYTGQEIVARMHYRGKAKKRLYRLELTSEEKVEVGSMLTHKSGVALGKIIKIQHDEGNVYQGLAILNSEVEGNILIKGLEKAEVSLQAFQY